MPKEVIKRALDRYTEPKDNESFTHVIYTKDSHIKNVEVKIMDLRREMERLEREYNSSVAHYKRDADKEVADLQAQADERVAEAHAEMEKHKKRADNFENINKNLIRVAVERANAKREIKPKKQHDGYIMLSVEEFIFNCEYFIEKGSSKIKIKKLPCFKMRLQSPYQINFDLDSAKNLIYDDLLKKLCKRLNFVTTYKNINGYVKNVVDEVWNREGNFVFSTKYKANTQKGFWEVEYLTRDMPPIPPDMIQNRGENYEKILPPDKARKTE